MTGTKVLTTARKMLEIIDAVGFSAGPVTVAEMADRFGWSRGAMHQYLHTAKEAGWFVQDDAGRYHLSHHVSVLARMRSAQADIAEILQPRMRQLAADLGEAVSFAVLDQGGLFIVERAEPVGIYQRQKFQTSISVTTSASGKAIVAHLSERERDRLRAGGAELAPPEVYAEVAERGFALVRSEWLGSDITAVAVPLMVRGHCMGALSVIAPAVRVDGTVAAEMTRRLLEMARNASGELIAEERTHG
ncbi:IclR family transcriptional regulator [Actinomadura sp. WAC 06369]|uniref:IclR family transcriptional regulator n=1 Tax=Actinomadura sp. WAC 06369 TaxID=2203193 RepID=UPI000F77C455|nr:helix-turn-helix domain-containing protein [Actinomadura sp. WAC 06369]